MKRRIAHLLAVPALMLLGASAPADEDLRTLKDMTIVEYEPAPLAGSGFYIVYRWAVVTAPDGARSKVYFIHAGQHDDGTSYYLGGRRGDPYPALGSKCDLETQTRGAVTRMPRALYDKMVSEGRDVARYDDVIVLLARC